MADHSMVSTSALRPNHVADQVLRLLAGASNRKAS